METPEEFLMKYGISSDTTIGIEGDKRLTELLEEYANQALRIHDVVGRSEQLCRCHDPMTQTNVINGEPECYHCGGKR